MSKARGSDDKIEAENGRPLRPVELDFEAQNLAQFFTELNKPNRLEPEDTYSIQNGHVLTRQLVVVQPEAH